MSRVTASILVDTNPYSLEKRKYGEVSGFAHAAYTSSIRIRIFPESNFFRGTEYPISGHVIKRGVSRPVNVLIFPDLPRIMECRWWTHVRSRFAGSTIPVYTMSYYQISSSHLTWTTVRVYAVLVGLRWPHQSIKRASSKCRNVCWCINFSIFFVLKWERNTHI